MNWKVLIVLSLSIFASTMGQGIVVPLLPAYALSMGASGFLIGLIFGMFSIARSIFLPYFGRLSDLKGRKPFISVGLFAYFCASVAFIFSDSVVMLITIRFFQGISSAMILPVAQAYAAEITDNGKEGQVMGIINIGFYSGLSAGPFLGGLIKATFGLRISFLSMGLMCLIGFLSSVFLLPSTQKEKKLLKTEELKRFHILIHNPIIAGLFLSRFGHILCVGALWSFLPLFAEFEFSLSAVSIGFIMSLTVMITAVCSIPMGILSDHMSKRLLMGAGGVLTAGSIVSLYWLDSIWKLYVIIIVTGIGGGILTPSTTAMSAVVGKNLRSPGAIMSIQNMGHSMGMFIGPILTGILMDFLNMKIAFVGGGAILFLLILISLCLMVQYPQMEKNILQTVVDH